MWRPSFIAALLLAGALVSSSCREDTALAQAPYRRTGRTMRFAPSGASAPTDIIQRYTWDVQYWSSDVVTTSWPEHNALAGHTLTAATQATTGVSTGSLTNLPAALVNAAITPDASAGYIGELNFASDTFHCRLIVDFVSSVNGDRAFRWLFSGTVFFEYRNTSDTAATVTFRDAVTTWAPSISFPAETGWLLIDISVNGTTGDIYVNGTDMAVTDPTGTVNVTNQLDAFGVTSVESGGNVADGNYLFFGCRFGTTISLADHQSDATTGSF